DLADPADLEQLRRRVLSDTGSEPVVASAVTGAGIDELVERIGLRLPGRRIRVSGTIPFERHDLVAAAHEHGEVHKEAHDADGTTLVATVDQDVALDMRPWLDDDPFAEEPDAWEA
ncbi:MAG: hypothetical protein R3343_13830, partial [Nitriliruptorales bacterium]|nr:hypothetical protein [Nitriliruptorales bacterium]